MRGCKFLRSVQTPVSQLTYLVHMDPSIFPNPHSFDPTRWIRAAQEGVKLEKFLVSFTKGSRVCLGIKSVRRLISYREHIISILMLLSGMLADTHILAWHMQRFI